MLRRFSPAAALTVVLGLALTTLEGRQLPLDALKDSGQAIYPAFEGWYQNADGSYSLLLGYYNRNQKQTLDIPVGPNNKVEPGGPDLGQPTYFQVRRGWGVFAIKVPKDFGSEKRYTWTIVANGKTVSVPVGLIKDYQIEPFKDAAEGNLPPVLKFPPAGKTHPGHRKNIDKPGPGRAGFATFMQIIQIRYPAALGHFVFDCTASAINA